MDGEQAMATLRALLRQTGCTDDEIDRAERDGAIALLALDRMLLPGPTRYDLRDVTERTGIDEAQVRHLWRSLGFPEPREGERLFTDVDVENLSNVAQLMSSGAVAPELVLQMSRVIGSSMDRIAQAFIDAVTLPAGEEGAGQVHIEAVSMNAGALLPTMPKVFDVVWRRHLQAAARRRLVQGTEAGTDLVVGFADLVGFTALSQQVSDRELASIIGQFEALAYDVVTLHRGRVVKMIGDEVMFVVDDARAATDIALALADALREDDELSDVRVGMAMGPVLEREGDCFGPTVNLAARATSIAFPGSVVVSSELHDVLAEDEAYQWRAMRPRFLKNIGRTQLWVLRRRGDAAPGPFAERRRVLRDAVRARIGDLPDRSG
jgi:adenylate cyclase